MCRKAIGPKINAVGWFYEHDTDDAVTDITSKEITILRALDYSQYGKFFQSINCYFMFCPHMNLWGFFPAPKPAFYS